MECWSSGKTASTAVKNQAATISIITGLSSIELKVILIILYFRYCLPTVEMPHRLAEGTRRFVCLLTFNFPAPSARDHSLSDWRDNWRSLFHALFGSFRSFAQSVHRLAALVQVATGMLNVW
jgi:hypothetical protein